jgi:hypothetical protein
MAIAVHSVNWGTFDQDSNVHVSGDIGLVEVNSEPLPDGDHIWLVVGDPPYVPTGMLRVVLLTDPAVTWYKEIKAFDASQQPGQWIATQDSNHGPVEMTLDLAHVKYLVFTKAKGIGIHTGMYALSDLGNAGGNLVTFTWQSD